MYFLAAGQVCMAVAAAVLYSFAISVVADRALTAFESVEEYDGLWLWCDGMMTHA